MDPNVMDDYVLGKHTQHSPDRKQKKKGGATTRRTEALEEGRGSQKRKRGERDNNIQELFFFWKGKERKAMTVTGDHRIAVC